MRIFKIHFYDLISNLRQRTIWICNVLLFWISFAVILLTIYRYGFEISSEVKAYISSSIVYLTPIFFILNLVRLIILFTKKLNSKTIYSELFLILFLFIISSVNIFFSEWHATHITYLNFLLNPIYSHLAGLFVFFIEFSRTSFSLLKPTLKPSIIILLSFLFLIILGTGLLLLPKATNNGISIIDALFTSTSAVCVTGLIVVDTATAFTPLGKGIILMLIQLGGLGIMTFTFFFGFFFKGNTSFQSQLFLKDTLNESNIGQIFKTLLKIIVFTLSVEAIGAYFFYILLDGPIIFRVKTAVFHSISAFCNAGFSNLTDGLYNSTLRLNYGFHFTIALLVIIGGLGFPVIFNYYLLLKHFIRNTIKRFLYPKLGYQHKPNVITPGIKLIVISTFLLIVCGTLLFLITEWNLSFANLPWYGKISNAFFASVTPRTAGFNTIDYSLFSGSSILITMLLMWIGASPGSTGGGIKTSTLAVAILSTISIARGKDHVEFLRTELSANSVRRAFAVIVLSLFIIGLSVFFVNFFNDEIDFKYVVFECISAFSTVGLSLGITSSLSVGSKLTLIVTMFIGRIGALTLLIGILRKVTVKMYRYPSQDVLIN